MLLRMDFSAEAVSMYSFKLSVDFISVTMSLIGVMALFFDCKFFVSIGLGVGKFRYFLIFEQIPCKKRCLFGSNGNNRVYLPF